MRMFGNVYNFVIIPLKSNEGCNITYFSLQSLITEHLLLAKLTLTFIEVETQLYVTMYFHRITLIIITYM